MHIYNRAYLYTSFVLFFWKYLRVDFRWNVGGKKLLVSLNFWAEYINNTIKYNVAVWICFWGQNFNLVYYTNTTITLCSNSVWRKPSFQLTLIQSPTCIHTTSTLYNVTMNRSTLCSLVRVILWFTYFVVDNDTSIIEWKHKTRVILREIERSYSTFDFETRHVFCVKK